jgi:hypothetical protein
MNVPDEVLTIYLGVNIRARSSTFSRNNEQQKHLKTMPHQPLPTPICAEP